MTETEPIFPAEFTTTIDAAVAHVLDGAPQPAGLATLMAWLGENYDSERCDDYDIYLDISRLVARHFYDYEVRDWLNLSEADPVNDEMRFEFAQHEISRALWDDDLGGAFESYVLTDSRGRSAILGTLFTSSCVRRDFNVELLGIFRDWQGLLDAVSERGYWFGEKLTNPEKAEVLAEWRRDEA